jgi:hypothetical protein
VAKVVDFKPLAPNHCGFESKQGLRIRSCEEAIQLAYRTSVVLLKCMFVPEIMCGRALMTHIGLETKVLTVKQIRL